MKKKDVKATKKDKEIKKLVEDKTFGVKNKNKSKQADTLTRQFAAQERGGYEKIKSDIFEERKKRKAEEEEKKLLVDVFAKTVARSEAAVEEERRICPLFKAGLCGKGKKCKLLHEGKEGRADKIDLFTDQRDQLFGEGGKVDTTRLREAVTYNEGKYNTPVKTEKVCKHFLDAVERRTYGWMWVCPNGYSCVFRHALPPDYEFPTAGPVEKAVQEDVADLIDREREKLDAQSLPRVSEADFLAWAEERRVRLTREREERVREEKRRLGLKAKKEMTGRELFEHQREIFEDDAEAMDVYDREEPEGEVEVDEGVFQDEELPDLD